MMILKTREEQKEAFADAVKQRRDSGAKYCNKCFDRGFTGWNHTTHKYVACKCLLDYTLKLQQDEINAQIKAREEAEHRLQIKNELENANPGNIITDEDIDKFLEAEYQEFKKEVEG